MKGMSVFQPEGLEVCAKGRDQKSGLLRYLKGPSTLGENDFISTQNFTLIHPNQVFILMESHFPMSMMKAELNKNEILGLSFSVKQLSLQGES